jgi:hypothetical protein
MVRVEKNRLAASARRAKAICLNLTRGGGIATPKLTIYPNPIGAELSIGIER